MRKSFLLVIVVLLAAAVLHAGTTGKLLGKVKDASGNPIPNASVIIPDLETGAKTNEKGVFIIINLPPGSYSVICQLMGFQSQQVNNVQISVDLTTTQNFQLNRQSVEIEGLIITERAEQLVKKEGGSDMTINADAIGELPMDDINEIASLQAGVSVVNGVLHVRGGRGNEVQYTVDGMSVSDPVDGGRALTIDTDAIAHMKTMIGGITAEYGNAQSGVINIVTKSGNREYSGKIEASSNHLFADGSNMDEVKFAIGGPVLGYFSDGLRNRFTFFLNGAALWQDGSLGSYRVGNPNADFTMDGRPLLFQDFDSFDPYQNRDNVLGFDTGDRNYNQYNFNLKTRFNITNTSNITVAVRGDISRSKPFDWGWRYALQHYQEVETIQRQYIATFDHTFTPQMNLKVKLSYYNKTIERGPIGIGRNDYFSISEDPEDYNPENSLYGYNSIDANNDGVVDFGYLGAEYLDADQWAYQVQGSANSRPVPGFNAPGTIYNVIWDDETSNIQFRSDFEYAYNTVHGFKTGFELISHDLFKDRFTNPWLVEEGRFQRFLQNFICTNPDSTDFFIHTFNGIIDTIRVGGDPQNPIEMLVFMDPVSVVDSVRIYYDTSGEITAVIPYFQPNIYLDAAFAASGESDGYKANPWQGAYYIQDTMEWEGLIVNLGLRFDGWYLGKSYDVRNDDGSYSTVPFDKDDRYQIMVSPRLGISHPISERDVIHFAYNYQNQLPQFQYIFTSAKPEDAIISTQNIIVGNPALEPQITITYEVGLQHQMGEDYVFDITAYYKNIYNYVNTKKEILEGDETISYYKYISEDYGSARGLNLNLQKMLSSYISGSVSYTIAWADGNNSAAVVQNENTSLREFPLDWDVRHDFNLNFRFTVQRDEDFYLPFTDWSIPLGRAGDFNTSLVYHIASGKPYTPATEEGTALTTNSERIEFSQSANFSLSKRIFLGERTNMKLSFQVSNLFNHKNVLGVYPITGSPTDPGADISEPNSDYVNSEVSFMNDKFTHNPERYSAGRTFTFGMAFNF
ncbi:MAG: carboxypeptidase regulatory-like domain-containing protein [Candidatus Cloacimonetes bacterium]|nr:carboxypeptidase regulatory-like domain-containing protein [Candidatus Cloacimonadota bacterium]